MTNEERAETARQALNFFTEQTNGDGDSQTVDLLTNLMHYCNQTEGRICFDSCLRAARLHYHAETEPSL